MIEYLEQLERDLVEAIDRGESAPRRRRFAGVSAPRLRLAGALPVAVVVVAVAAVISFVAVLGRNSPRHHVTKPPLAKHGHETAIPLPLAPHTAFRIVGIVHRVNATTWRGDARGLGGLGTLTITGTIDMTPRPCCDVPRSSGLSAPHRVVFRWTTPNGSVRGCVDNRIFRRPHGRYVWDGVGQITAATGALSRYRGRAVGIAGNTPVSSRGEAQIIIGTGAPLGRC